jgi:hypothetical protein
LAVVLETPPSARTDPWEVLKSNKLTAFDLIPVPGEATLIAEREGWLVFIINEAVVSPASPSRDSQLYYETLKLKAEELEKDSRHRIPLQSIPLLWFADNNGAFRVTIKTAE